jgi:non-homologous end joining protein Ku
MENGEYGIEMIRAVKKTLIQFGLVGIPVKLSRRNFEEVIV